jgi:hypothetical protein
VRVKRPWTCSDGEPHSGRAAIEEAAPGTTATTPGCDGEPEGAAPGVGREQVVDVHDGTSWVAGGGQGAPSVILTDSHHEPCGRSVLTAAVTRAAPVTHPPEHRL